MIEQVLSSDPNSLSPSSRDSFDPLVAADILSGLEADGSPPSLTKQARAAGKSITQSEVLRLADAIQNPVALRTFVQKIADACGKPTAVKYRKAIKANLDVVRVVAERDLDIVKTATVSLLLNLLRSEHLNLERPPFTQPGADYSVGKKILRLVSNVVKSKPSLVTERECLTTCLEDITRSMVGMCGQAEKALNLHTDALVLLKEWKALSPPVRYQGPAERFSHTARAAEPSLHAQLVSRGYDPGANTHGARMGRVPSPR